MKNKQTGQQLYKKAKKLIPGGTMLLSKRPEMFLPELWPSYYNKAKGKFIWDLDNTKYLDMSIMGIGTSVLGYSNKEVDNAVIKNIRKGNMATLNCPEEVELAERLVELNPWADMVRFAKTGGEANMIAIRIARASAAKSKVAVCGYHGWHDWYLSMNLKKSDNLKHHLLPNLDIKGVPEELEGTVFPFFYNDFNSLLDVVNNQDIGVIKMEVERSYPPKDNFLERVRKLCDQKSIVLIFDECTSGFRETDCGLYKKHNVLPDIVIYGKALGNGFPITAIVGKKSVMEAAQETFISSTFWTERSGVTAALKTLEIMNKNKTWEYITGIGQMMKSSWEKYAKINNVEIELLGIPAIANFIFKDINHNKYKTYMTKMFYDNKILASNLFYPSTAHSKSDFTKYDQVLDKTFYMISKFQNGTENIEDFIETPFAHNTFKRLN